VCVSLPAAVRGTAGEALVDAIHVGELNESVV